MPVGDVLTADLPAEDLAVYADAHGLWPAAPAAADPRVPPPAVAPAQLHLAFATARNVAMYTEARLGQLWQVLTPLLNAGVYFLIFGVLLHVSRGIPNYLGFLVTGVFVFNFTQRAFISTSTVITDSLPLIRALQFPRAALPLAYVIIELQQMLLSMAVLVDHHPDHRRADHLVLAAGHPGAAAADRSSTWASACSWPGSARRSTTSASCCRSCCAPGCTSPACCSASRP